ncbi:hypothetical protein AB0I84_15775 [Streptomyces spectabilis]|uniref:hypothetical protein n=1 Tax=Streptomyces spectabilis TaxID=68270 RepID=UPI0033FB88BB
MHVTPVGLPLGLTLFTPLDPRAMDARPAGHYDARRQISLDGDSGQPLCHIVVDGTTLSTLSPAVVSRGEGQDAEESGVGW